jgi:LemA protein
MKKRLDMVEQLVDSVKSYAHFERGTLERITTLRSGLFSAGPQGLQKIDGGSRSLLADIKAVAESYPDLKTSEAVVATMNAIRDVEDEISRHRYTYNNVIQEFNTMLDTLPSSFIGSLAKMHKLEYLNFEEEELRKKGYLTSEDTEPPRPEVDWKVGEER